MFQLFCCLFCKVNKNLFENWVGIKFMQTANKGDKDTTIAIQY